MLPVVLFLASFVLGFAVWARTSAWAHLAQHYPLGEEWPDRVYRGTMVSADPVLYRVTAGASSRGITFHGFFLRLAGSAVFVPWPEVTEASEPSRYLGSAVRLAFRAAPSLHIALPEAVWLNMAGQRPAARQRLLGV